MVHSIMKHATDKLRAALIEENENMEDKSKHHDIEAVTLETLYDKFGWDLYDKYEHAYDAFRFIMNDQEEHLKGYKLTDTEKKALVEAISKRMTPQPLKIRADFKINCPTREGIYALRSAIKACKDEINDEHFQAEILIVAPPLYKIEVVSLEKQKAIQKIDQGLKVIKKVMAQKGGDFKLEKETYIIGGGQEKDLEEIKANLPDVDPGSISQEEEEGIDVDEDEDF